MSDPIQSIARHLGIQTFGDGLLAKIGQTIDLLQEAARNRAALATECERLRREAKNDAIAYKAAIERQNEIRTERDAALAELAALKGGRDDAELADRMKAAGMLSVAERMAGQPLDGFMRHAGVHDLATFAQWLEMRRAECLKMHARFELEGRENDDELYEWVIAHAAVFSEVHINFKAAMEAPPAQASAWVAVSERLPSAKTDGRMVLAFVCGVVCTKATSSIRELVAVAEEDGEKCAATHWQPLPAAPTPGASDGKGGDHSAHDLNMVQVPKDLHLITLGMLSSYVTTLAEIDFPDNDEGDYQQRLNENKRAAVNSTIAKLRALIVSAGKAGEP